MSFNSNLVILSWSSVSKQGLTCHNAPLLFCNHRVLSHHSRNRTIHFLSAERQSQPRWSWIRWRAGRLSHVKQSKDAGGGGVVFQGPSLISTGTLRPPVSVSALWFTRTTAGCPPAHPRQTPGQSKGEVGAVCTVALLPFLHRWKSHLTAFNQTKHHTDDLVLKPLTWYVIQDCQI